MFVQKEVNPFRRRLHLGDNLTDWKRKSGKAQVDESYQPGNIGTMAGTIPSVKKKKK